MITMLLMNRHKQEHKYLRTQGQHRQLTTPVIEVPQVSQQMSTPSFVPLRYIPKTTTNRLWTCENNDCF